MINKIVVADADPAFCASVQAHFKNSGYDVFAAHNGQEALDLISKFAPDVIITDTLLPVISGFDLCKAVKNNPHSKDTPIIVVSTSSNMEDSFLFLGIKDFLYRPFEMAQLEAKVTKRLDLVRAMNMQKTKILFHGVDGMTLSGIKGLIAPITQWAPEFVTTGKALLEKAAEFVPDVLVVDLFMNDMHVDTTIAQLKQMPALAHAEILVYYSPFATSQDGIALQAKMIEVQYLKRIASEAGAREYLGPFNPSNFVSLFDEYRKDLAR